MKIENSTFNFLKDWELIKYEAYNDGFNYWTIGLGHNINASERFDLIDKKITDKEVIELLELDFKRLKIEERLEKIKIPLEQFKKDAIISLIFNLGYLPESIIILMNSKNKVALKNKWMEFCKATDAKTKKKKTVLGLYRRRTAEYDLFVNEYKGRRFYDKIKLPT
jgi:GH24 family phage-related lysozyme (muramidase)